MELIRRARLARGLSQSELAKVSGIAQPNISAFESGRTTPSATTLARLLEACGFELVARAGSTVVRVTPPVSEGSPAGRASMSPQERNRTLCAVLELAETVVRSRGT